MSNLTIPPRRMERRSRTGMTLTDFQGCSVLVVDDEAMVREVVAAYLTRDGFSVTEASDGRSALQHIETQPTDLIVLDVMLPETDGLSVLSAVRQHADTPVILLTARGDEADRVLGLELGADDYLVKPFSPRELAARVRTVLKRTMSVPRQGERIEYDGISVDPASRQVTVAGETVELTPKEFDLLFFLASSPRQVFSRAQILDHVWDSNSDWQDPSTVTVHIRRLRQKVEDDPQAPQRLATVWGVGYRFNP